MKFILICVIVLLSIGLFSSLHKLEKIQEEVLEELNIQHEKFSRQYQRKLSIMCCFYTQHYHDCFSAVNHSGCVLGTAKAGGVSPTVICSRNNGCDLPMSMAGFFLTGFEWNCDECDGDIMHPYMTYWEASRYPPSELSQKLSQLNDSDTQYSDYF